MSDDTQAETKLIDLPKIAKNQIDLFSKNCQGPNWLIFRKLQNFQRLFLLFLINGSFFPKYINLEP